MTLSELKTNWQLYFFHPPTDEEIKRRIILERKGHCEIDEERIERYHETQLLKHES